MSRQIVLTACIIFIAYLLIRDTRRKPNVSWALWIPWIWFAIWASRPLSFWFGAGVAADSPDYYLEGSPFDRNIFIVLMLIGIIILIKRKVDWPKIFKNNIFIFIYIGYLGLSTLWSDYTFVSFKRWTKDLGHIIMVLIVLTENNYIEAIKTMFKRAAYVLIPLSIVFNKYFPEIGRMWSKGGGDPQYRGITMHKNSLGQICMVFGLIIFWSIGNLWRQSKENKDTRELLINILFISAIIYLLYLSNSATSTLASILGIIIIAGLGLTAIKTNVKAIKYYVLFLGLMLIVIHLSFDITSLITSVMERDETFTGRTQIWDDVLSMGTNPIIGTGYDSFWMGERAEFFWDKYWWHPTQAHNGYLEVYINLGILGLMLFFCVIVSVFRNIYKNLAAGYNYDYQALRMAFIVIFLAINITEANFKGFIWSIFLLLAFEPPVPAMVPKENNDDTPQPNQVKCNYNAIT